MARTHYLTPKLYNKLYAVMQYENALALRTSLETGWRIGDVLSLSVCDLNGRTLTCVAQKTDKPDKKVISADLAKRLRQIAANGRIFDGRYGNKPRTRQTVWKDVKKAAKLLQLDGNIAPHSARKTYAVEDFHEHGLAETQKHLQHDRLSTTMLYAFSDLINYTPALERRVTDTDERAAAVLPKAKPACGIAAPTLSAEASTVAEFAEHIRNEVIQFCNTLLTTGGRCDTLNPER